MVLDAWLLKTHKKNTTIGFGDLKENAHLLRTTVLEPQNSLYVGRKSTSFVIGRKRHPSHLN